MPKTIRVGIIGAGGIARHAHVPGYQAQQDVELAAICDVVPGKAASLATEHDIPHAYDGCEEMLEEEELDAVSVCTPNFAHKEATLMALEAGLHVLCEKPIAMNVQEGREMVEAARKRDLVLQIGLHRRFEPASRTLKRFVEAGELGDIYYGEATYMRRRGIPSWGVFTQKKYQGGGALIDIGVHTLDLTMWLMGNPKPVAVSGMTYDIFGKRTDVVNTWGPWDPETFDVDDMSVALVRFEGDVTLMLRACWAAHIGGNESETRILGTEGGASMEPLRIFRDVHGAMVDIAPSGLPEVEPHTEEIAHFIDCVRGEAECLVVPEQVLDVQAVIDAIYKSAEEGREVLLSEFDY
ncbi:MAG: Gfo/Idh/MocA family oxidoreductase [Chloroflexota bacterium]|nr:Gfo/Idh/MocA family oxidoreductase [Chloroflexota bacterium]